MLAPLADIEDLAGWLGVEPQTLDPMRAISALNGASALVRERAGQSWDDEPAPDFVRAITVQVAVRIWENPAGLESETAGAWTGRYGTSRLTAEESAILAGSRPSGAVLWGLSTTRGPLETRMVEPERADE